MRQEVLLSGKGDALHHFWMLLPYAGEVNNPSQPDERSHLYAFIDESERNDSHYFMSALLGDYENLQSLGGELEEVVEKHSRALPILNRGFEIHACDIMGGHGDYRKVPVRLRIAIMDDVFTAISSANVKLFISGINIHRHLAREYSIHYPAREMAFAWLLERLNEHAVSLGPRHVVNIYADNHHTAPQAALKLGEYRRWGTKGYRSSRLGRIVDPLIFCDSKEYRALQASDAVTYLYNRIMTVDETDDRAKAKKSEWWESLGPRIHWERTWP